MTLQALLARCPDGRSITHVVSYVPSLAVDPDAERTLRHAVQFLEDWCPGTSIEAFYTDQVSDVTPGWVDPRSLRKGNAHASR